MNHGLYGRGVMENVAALQQLFLLSAPFKGTNKSHALYAWLFTPFEEIKVQN